MARVLYLTLDGIADHIGQSQIAPYVLGLARLGHSIHMVSAEKPGRELLKQKYKSLFDQAGVKWSTIRYSNRPPLVSSALVLWRMYRTAHSIMARERQQVIHCRSYLPFEIAVPLKLEFGAKLLLDFRDFWPDLRLETSRFKSIYRHLKHREPRYFDAASHVVTLTEKAVDVLTERYPEALRGRRDSYTVIPCCADFDHFDSSKVAPATVARRRDELGLGEGPVLLYLGSLGPDYLLREMFKLFAELLALRGTAKFLFVSNNAAESVANERAAAGIPEGAVKFVSVDRAQVPEYVALADLSVVFVRQTPAKAGGSPAKLAELFALGVPVVANTGIGDLDAILDFDRNGSVIVRDFTVAELRSALQRVLALSPQGKARIRENSREFSLDRGIQLYDGVYRRLSGADEESAERAVSV